MFPFRTVEIAFRRFQTRREPRALAVVFDRTAPELLTLARHLAPPGSEAEDLLQATFVTAIEAAASHRYGERVLPWLCGILANHARAARRRGRRAVDPQRLPHAVADAGLDAEGAELRAELRAAIDRLPEVYRPVLRLVFENGLQAQEVAHALERPAGTVRAQVTRGLELLRRTLPASLAGGVAVAVGSGRGLAAVRQSVLGKAGGTAVGSVSPLYLGGLLLLQHKLLAAGIAALFAALGLLWLLQPPPEPLAPETVPPRAPTVAARSPLDRRPDEPERRTVATAPAAPAPDAATAAATAPAAVGSVRVRLRDTQGQAVPGVGVAVFPFAQMQDLGRRMDYVVSDAAGEVRFTALERGDWAIDVDRVGTSGVFFAAPAEQVERVVTLPAGVRAEGHVVDRRGAPIAGATLVLHSSRASTTEVATTDALGAFTVEHLAPGVELQARAPRREPSLARTVRGAAATTVQLRFELGDQAHTVRGYVLDPDGRRVDGAVVAILPTSARVVQVVDRAEPQVRAVWLRTAADGSFGCDEIGAGPQIVFARKLPFAPAWVEVDATRGDATAELRLRVGATLSGTVTRGDEPVAGVNVLDWATGAAPIGYLQNLFGLRHAVTGADGSYRIDGILPGEQTVSLMQQTTTLRRATLTLDEGLTHTWNADLAAAQALRIVLRGERLPAEARVVALVHSKPLRDGDAPSMVPIQADGTGELQLARDGTVDVTLTMLPGGMSMVQFARAADVPANQHEVVFELRAEQLPQRRITGRLVDDRRAPVADATVTASRVDAGGLVVRLDATTARDGTFCLGPLPSGSYRLYAGPARSPVAIGRAVLTVDRDEAVGDLVAGPR